MKTISSKIVLLVTMTLFLSAAVTKSQNSETYYSISGVVKDKSTGKAVKYVNVSAKGTHVGTVTNEDGEFMLKIQKSLSVNEIELSCIGYFNAKAAVSKKIEQNQNFYIIPQSFQINEIEVFSWKNPCDLVELAMEKIEKNYSMSPNLLTGFYRETIQKKGNFIHISEAVIQVYKTSYMMNVDNDKVQILKGRKLISSKKNDTLDVKFIGGPNMPVVLDIVKNPDIVLSKEDLDFYSFKMGETTSINDKLQYVVHFQPQVNMSYPLYNGTLYIDRENFSISRAEFSIDMSDKSKVIDAILKDKPLGLRFTPEEVTYTVTYKQLNNKTYLNYINNVVKFKCDWKRKLFATYFVINNETVITDIEENNVSKIAAKDAFSTRKSLSYEVAAYFDEDFWGAYNIIEPSESLENAVNRLKKHQK